MTALIAAAPTLSSNRLAVVVVGCIALILFIGYAFANRRARGHIPHWEAEVYLCFDFTAPPHAAAAPVVEKLSAAFKAEIATLDQVRAYFAEGGNAHGYGFVSDVGGAVGAVPAAGGGLAVAAMPCADPEGPVGVWLYGAKPRRGTPGVTPFSCTYWFHPA